MTKEEFIKYLESFNKKPGEYTDEELYQIGVTHKSLNHEDKSWNALIKYLGVNKSSETFRNWILKKQAKDGTLKRNNKMLSDKTVEELTMKETTEELRKQTEDLYKAKVAVRDTYNAYRNNLRKDARQEDFQNLLIEAITHFEPLETSFINAQAIDEFNKGDYVVEAVLALSDLHLGACFENSYNAYNRDIAQARLVTLANSVIKYCKQFNVGILHIVNLGDMIHGLIHIGGRLEQDLNTASQIVKASDLVAKFLNAIQYCCPVVDYRWTTDNHGRMVANIKENQEIDNAQKLIDEIVRLRLQNSAINFIDDEDGFKHQLCRIELVNGKVAMCSHGHHDSKASVTQDFTALNGGIQPDYIIMGHFHNPAQHSFQNTNVFINGSILGTDTYAYEHRLFCDPSQKLLIFDDNNIIDIDIKL